MQAIEVIAKIPGVSDDVLVVRMIQQPGQRPEWWCEAHMHTNIVSAGCDKQDYVP